MLTANEGFLLGDLLVVVAPPVHQGPGCSQYIRARGTPSTSAPGVPSPPPPPYISTRGTPSTSAPGVHQRPGYPPPPLYHEYPSTSAPGVPPLYQDPGYIRAWGTSHYISARGTSGPGVPPITSAPGVPPYIRTRGTPQYIRAYCAMWKTAKIRSYSQTLLQCKHVVLLGSRSCSVVENSLEFCWQVVVKLQNVKVTVYITICGYDR